MDEKTVANLTSLIDLGRRHQHAAVAWTLTRLLTASQKGVVLADEVGCGKTYEALAVLALLWHHFRTTPRPISRVLILCKSGLLRKWQEELTTPPGKDKHGIRSYLRGKEWRAFNARFIDRLFTIENVHRANKMWWGSRDASPFQGVRTRGRIQVPKGLYLVNSQLLYASRRDKAKPLKYLMNTDWDLVIADEAHHFGKGNDCDSIFANRYWALGRDGRPDFGAEGTLRYRYILLLTATPFELDPREMLNLLRIVRADEGDIGRLGESLKKYQEGLNTFYDLRALPPSNERRRGVVEHLRQLRLGLDGADGLEGIMRRYVTRNLRETAQRAYYLLNRGASALERQQFSKFDDLKSICARAALIPFLGPDAIFYLELRELIQDVLERRRDNHGDAHGTFVAMDLQQGLSSYPQLLAPSYGGQPKRLLEQRTDRAERLRRLLDGWTKTGRLHPKVRALVETVRTIVGRELQHLEAGSQPWIAKVVVFNKLVAGTAPHIRKQLELALKPCVEAVLDRLVARSAFATAQDLRKAARLAARRGTQEACKDFSLACKKRHEDPRLDRAVLLDAGFESTRGMHAVEALGPYFERRASQPIFLLDFLLSSRNGGTGATASGLDAFVRENIIRPATKDLDGIIDKYLDSQPSPDEGEQMGRYWIYETGIRRLSLLRESLRSPELVARYDGEVVQDRESNRINFNNRWNPLVLIVSRVGEEGIDLQRQARHILHYDLEWNPAKMEQREGRVDREGYGFAGHSINVEFLLLKNTYEERIFHTVMQRDQWFRILLGERRRRLGVLDVEDDAGACSSEQAELRAVQTEAGETVGNLTQDEIHAVMLDLQSPSLQARNE